jgi:hypothetical protein
MTKEFEQKFLDATSDAVKKLINGMEVGAFNEQQRQEYLLIAIWKELLFVRFLLTSGMTEAEVK